MSGGRRSTRGWHCIFQLSAVREQLYASENRVIGGCVLRLQEGYDSTGALAGSEAACQKLAPLN